MFEMIEKAKILLNTHCDTFKEFVVMLNDMFPQSEE